MLIASRRCVYFNNLNSAAIVIYIWSHDTGIDTKNPTVQRGNTVKCIDGDLPNAWRKGKRDLNLRSNVSLCATRMAIVLTGYF